MNLSLTIIVPVYNEEGNLKALFERFEKIKKTIELKKISTDYIFVNDGSEDDSLNILQELANYCKHLKIISFSRNFGHQNAIIAGIQFSESDFTVIIDSDLQDPPELIIEMIELSTSGNFEVVYAKRKRRKGETFFKKLTAKIFYKIFNLFCGVKIPQDVGDYRLITKKVLDELKRCKEKNKFIRGLIPWLGFKSAPVIYERDERHMGKTSYSLSKMINLASNSIFSFSSIPITLLTKFGLFFIFISLFYTIIVLYKKIFFNNIVPGFTAVLIFVTFFGGINLFFLGIIGQYISKVFEQTKDRPEYVIEKKINF
jgi:glycosyltransferase involved in cell wall biosynthesis